MNEDKAFINEKMNKFDTDHTGTLNKEQLKKLLEDLNEGEEITDFEVDNVFQSADLSKTGVINQTEIRKAVNEWFAYCAVAEANNRVIGKKGESGPKQPKKGCCVVS